VVASVKDWLALTRIKLTVFVSLSAAVGHVIAVNALQPAALAPALGGLLLAAGGSALNQTQERAWDARMQRTRTRPLPAGRLAPRWSLITAGALILAGLGVLMILCGWRSAALGAAAIAWYNAVYTPLKRRTAFAAVPGAVIGALGPAIGWAAAGAPLTSPRLLAVGAVFFLWQVPHFWVLHARYAAEYRAAGYPTMASALGERGLARVIYVWAVAAMLAALALPLFGLLQRIETYALLAASALLLSVLGLRILRGAGLSDIDLRRGFAGINLFALLTMILLVVDRIMRP
jgi:heme o synthase